MKLVWFAVLCLFVVPSSFALEGFASPRADVSLSGSLVVSDSVVYSSGFVSDDGASWEEFSFTGRTRGNWIVGTASSTVRTNANYYAIYSCSWSDGWTCSSGWEVYDQSTQPPSDYISKDSIQGDFEALQALYESTQGQQLEVLPSQDDLPEFRDAQYPYMYMINGDIWQITYDGNSKYWYNAGPPWTDKTGWDDMTPETMGEAVGISVNENGRVVEVDMQGVTTVDTPQGTNQDDGNNLAGTLPKELGNLKKVTDFNVKQNQLMGPLPPEIGLMENLQRLRLAGQRGIPSIRIGSTPDHRGQAGGKEFENTNAFRSDLPPEWSQLEHIEVIELRHQWITGTLPAAWGNANTLRGLFIDNPRGENSLTGSIPGSWGNLHRLQSVYLGNGGSARSEENAWGPGLTGEIPTEFQEGMNATERFRIFIGGNSLEGTTPEFNNVAGIREYRIGGNNFVGGFPMHLFNRGENSAIYGFDISHNNLVGPISQEEFVAPPNKETYTGISTMNLAGNDFTGPIPQWIHDMRHIQALFQGQSFTGGFPTKIANGSRLRLFWFGGNELSGPLTDVNWNSPALYSILIGGNNFEGEIPASWESMVTNYLDDSGEYNGRIWRISLGSNNLEGPVPAWFADITTLNRLYLDENKFTFADILPVYDDILATMEIAVITGRNSEPDFRVAPQQPFGDSESQNVGVGDSLVVDFSDDVGYQGNVYVWSRDGEVVSGQDSSVLRINSVSAFDAGEYVLEVSNSGLPELVLESVPVSVSVS